MHRKPRNLHDPDIEFSTLEPWEQQSNSKRKSSHGFFITYITLYRIFLFKIFLAICGYSFFFLNKTSHINPSFRKIHHYNTLSQNKNKYQNSTSIILSNNKTHLTHFIEKTTSSIFPFRIYNLRESLYTPKDYSDEEVLNLFLQKWNLNDIRYKQCGLISNQKNTNKIQNIKICDIVIITSWYPRPCGIATHSNKLIEALQAVCTPNSRIDVIAVRNKNENYDFPSIVKRSFYKDDSKEYVNIVDLPFRYQALTEQ
eukprot:gene11849-24839_t